MAIRARLKPGWPIGDTVTLTLYFFFGSAFAGAAFLPKK